MSRLGKADADAVSNTAHRRSSSASGRQRRSANVFPDHVAQQIASLATREVSQVQAEQGDASLEHSTTDGDCRDTVLYLMTISQEPESSPKTTRSPDESQPVPTRAVLCTALVNTQRADEHRNVTTVTDLDRQPVAACKGQSGWPKMGSIADNPERVVPMEFALEKPIGTGVCETCAERGRPNEPVYKIGMCEFCYKGLPHPHATKEQLARERGCEGSDRSTSSPGR